MRILFLLLSSMLATSAMAQITSKQWAAMNQPVKPFRIIGNVYYVGASDIGVYLITTPQGNILLDGGFAETAPQIERNIATLGFQLNQVKYLLNSHAHVDHAAGLQELKAQSGAVMLASEADTPFLTAGKQVYFSRRASSTFPPVKVDRTIRDGDTLQLGGVTLTAHLTPGHTKGCTTWTMPVTEGGQTHHVVFLCSTTSPDYILVNNPKYPNIAADYKLTFERLRLIDGDVFLAAHASFFDMEGKRARIKPGAPNPFVNPGEFRTFVNQTQADFERKLKQQQQSSSPSE